MEKYKRILLKVSGESLAGDNKTGINFDAKKSKKQKKKQK